MKPYQDRIRKTRFKHFVENRDRLILNKDHEVARQFHATRINEAALEVRVKRDQDKINNEAEKCKLETEARRSRRRYKRVKGVAGNRWSTRYMNTDTPTTVSIIHLP